MYLALPNRTLFLLAAPWRFIACPCLLLLMCLSLGTEHVLADVVVVENGQPRAAIFVPPRLLADPEKNPEPGAIWNYLKPAALEARLRESVWDLAGILERITGAKVEVIAGPPAADEKRIPILIGELATEKFGAPQKAYPFKQGLRIVVNAQGVGLSGESDLGTSYAIYTLLDQLGCRWYMPSPTGEVLPKQATLALPEQDLSTGPSTAYRGIIYADSAFGRRNRLGGLCVAAGHHIELVIPKEMREAHPEIRAIIGGKPHPHFIKWTHPLVADKLTELCLQDLEKDPGLLTWSLSPDDGATWDETDDTKYDAGDFDPSTQTVAKMDRLLVLCNKVAERVTAKYPEVKFGMLAYVDYTRPPVREKPHPAIVPQIAPITFSRAHPMDDAGEPNNPALRALVEGWGKTVPATSYYFYCFYLAEVASPNPMITKWSHDIPYIYEKGKCQYWQPETLANFETCLHALCLGHRMAWDTSLKPAEIIAELHAKFYGAAAKDMAAYWKLIDQIWVTTPEYAGCGFGHLRRFTPERMAELRKLLNQAAAAAQTPLEKERVELANLSFRQWEMFMQMRQELAAGKFAGLGTASEAYTKMLIELGERFQPQYCFSRMAWTGERTLSVRYYDAFYKATHEDAARIAKDFTIVSPTLRNWKYQADKELAGEKAHWELPVFDDQAWKATDPAVETWSTLGLHNHMGSLWYRTAVKLPPGQPGKKTFLWIGATDGRVKVFVNGKHVPYVDSAGKSADSFTGYCQPASFEITSALNSDGNNQISLFCTREILNELGTGGLLAAPVIYQEK